jgi:hypothetical protein
MAVTLRMMAIGCLSKPFWSIAVERGAASDRLAQATGRSIITASASNEENS